MFRLGGIRSDSKGVFLTNKSGEMVCRAGEGCYFNFNELEFDSSNICYVRSSITPTKILKNTSNTYQTVFETAQSSNENIWFRMASLAPNSDGKYYLYSYKKKFVVEGVVRGKDGR